MIQHSIYSQIIYETFKKESPKFIQSIEDAVNGGIMTLTDIKRLAWEVFHDQPINRGIAITVATYLFDEKNKN